MNGYMLEIYTDLLGEHRWRLRATNGQIVAEGGEGYTRRSSLLETVSQLPDAFANAGIVDIHPAPKSELEDDEDIEHDFDNARRGAPLGDRK